MRASAIGNTVVGEGDGARLRQCCHFHKLRAAKALRDGGQGIDPCGCGFPRTLQDECHSCRSVNHRIGIGHAAYRCKAAANSSARASCNSLFILKARFTEMAMQIHEAGRKD